MRRKQFKQLLTLAVLLTFLFSSILPAAAAPVALQGMPSAELDGQKLIALGVLTGYEDGDLKPDQTITRAEFAAIVVRALGLGSAAEGAKSYTKFSDVKTNEWYTGFINLASETHVITGYPDGTFKPNDDVTYAEAVTMLVRALGYEPEVKQAYKGAWPANYLSKAANLGITSGVNLVANVPATRGDVFKMTVNSLDEPMMEQEQYGDETTFIVRDGRDGGKEKTLLTEMDIIEVEDAIVVKTPVYAYGDLDWDEIEISLPDEDGDYDREIFTIAEGINPDAYIGLEVTVWYKDKKDVPGNASNDSIVFMEVETDPRDIITNDYIYEVKNNRISLDIKDRTYDLAEDAIVILNGWPDEDRSGNEYLDPDLEDYVWASRTFKDEDGTGTITLDDVNPFIGATTKVILDKNDDVRLLIATNGDTSMIVESIEPDDELIYYWDDSENESKMDIGGVDYIVFRNGQLASLEDVEEGDVFTAGPGGADYSGGDEFYVLNFWDKKVTGVVDEIFADDSDHFWDYVLVIDGEEYQVGGMWADYQVPGKNTISFDDNDTIDELTEDDLDDIVGEEVTLYLKGNGEIRHIVSGGEAGSQDDFGAMIVEEPYIVRSANGDNYYVKLLIGNGREIGYEITDDTEILGVEVDDVDDAYSDYIRGTSGILDELDPALNGGNYFVAVSLKADGSLDSIIPVDASTEGIWDDDDYDFEDKDDQVAVGTVDRVDDDNDIIRVDVDGSIVTVIADHDTECFTLYSDGVIDPDIVDWDDIEDKLREGDEILIKYENGVLEQIVALNADADFTGANETGMVLARGRNRDGDTLTLDINGEKVTYNIDDVDLAYKGNSVSESVYDDSRSARYLNVGDLVDFDYDSGDGTIQDVVERLATIKGEVVDIDTRSGIIEVEGYYHVEVTDENGDPAFVLATDADGKLLTRTMYFKVNNDTVIYNTDDSPVSVGLEMSDIRKRDMVLIWEDKTDKGVAEYIAIYD